MLNKVKNNNKGYMLVELILASMIAFSIAYFAIDITIKLKEKNDDLLVETQTVTDQAIITNKLMWYIKEEKENFDCESVTIDGKAIKYKNDLIDIVNDFADVGKILKNCNEDYIRITIPLHIKQIPNKNFDAVINNYNYNNKLINVFDNNNNNNNLKYVYEVSNSYNILNCRNDNYTECYGSLSKNDPNNYVRISSSGIEMSVGLGSSSSYALFHTGIEDLQNYKKLVVLYDDSYIDGSNKCLRAGIVIINNNSIGRINQSFKTYGYTGESDAILVDSLGNKLYSSKIACPNTNNSIYSGSGSFSLDLSNLKTSGIFVLFLPGSSSKKNNYLKISKIYLEK